MPKRTHLLGVACLLSLLTAPRLAAPCSCLSYPYWPRLVSTAEDLPPNGVIMVSLPDGFGTDFVLRPVGSDREIPHSVVVQQMSLEGHSTPRRVALLTPNRALPHEERFELTLETPEREHPKRVVVGTFVTNDHEDTRAPRLDAPLRIAPHVRSRRCFHEAWLEVSMRPARDDGPYYYAVWFARDQAPFPTTPQFRVEPRSGTTTQRVERPSCYTDEFPDDPGLYRVKIAAIDEAGHQSQAYVLPLRVP